MSQERMSPEQRESIAEDIRNDGQMAKEVAVEEYFGGGPVLDEAAAEMAEGGGPVAEAVKEFDQQQADAANMELEG